MADFIVLCHENAPNMFIVMNILIKNNYKYIFIYIYYNLTDMQL